MGESERKNQIIEELVKKAFDNYDVDDSGFLERKEIQQLFQDTCRELDVPLIEDDTLDIIISRIDINNDGKLAWDEFRDVMKPIILKGIDPIDDSM